MELVFETELSKEISSGCHSCCSPRITEFKTESHIVNGGEGMQETKSLEDKSYLVATDCGLFVFGQSIHQDAINEDATFIGRQQATKH